MAKLTISDIKHITNVLCDSAYSSVGVIEGATLSKQSSLHDAYEAAIKLSDASQALATLLSTLF